MIFYPVSDCMLHAISPLFNRLIYYLTPLNDHRLLTVSSLRFLAILRPFFFQTLINYHSNPHVHVVLIDPNHPVSAQFGGVAVPAVHIFKRDNPHSPSYSSNEAMDFIKIQKEVDKYLEHIQEPAIQDQVGFFGFSFCSLISEVKGYF